MTISPPTAGDLSGWSLCLLLVATVACGMSQQTPRSDRSFDEICLLVRGKSAAQVEAILGVPDTRRVVFGGDERWIWWNYTYLSGPAHPPELRGKIVHFEMVFRKPRENDAVADYSEWRAEEGLLPEYRLPLGSDKP